jgi:tetratricopeptide (TPR) repeat protein
VVDGYDALVTQPTDVVRAPLVGRRAELERITNAIDRQRCRGVALIGPAGVGKTRLADEARLLAEATGRTVVSATANETSARLTLGALAHLLPPASDLADLHQDLQPAQLLQSARNALAERAGERGLVISIDDAHHLDPVAAHLINHLAVTDAAFVILTIRSGETVPPAISALWKDGHVERVDLRELSADDTGPIASGILGAPVDTEVASWLTSTSAGNALFLRELVLAGRDDGTLVSDRGVWRLASTGRAASPRLTELVEQRLQGLGPDERRAVEIIALAEPIGLELIEELVGMECLETLDGRGLVRVVADGRRLGVALAHPLYVEALRRGAMTLRKRADLGTVAGAVSNHGARRREDAVRVATWQLARGGRADPAVIFRAALTAQLNLDDHSAVELSTAGLAQDPPPTLRAEFHLCRGLAQARLGRFVDARPDLVQAAALASTTDQVSRSAVRLAAAILESDGDLHGAVNVLDHAIEKLTTEAERVDLRLERATLLADAGKPLMAREELDRIDVANLRPDQRVTHALAVASEHLGAGRPESCIAACDVGLHDHLSNLDVVSTYHPSSHFLPRILALIDLGDLDRAEQDAEFIRRRGEDERRPLSVTAGKVFVAMVHLRRGRARSAANLAGEAIDSAPAQLQAYLQRLAWATLAQAHAALGDRVAAEGALAEFNRRGSVIDGFGAVEAMLAPARVAHVGGRSFHAAVELRRAVEQAFADGNFRVAFAGLHELVHTHLDVDAAHSLIELTATGEGPLLALWTAHARAALLDGRAAAAALSDVAAEYTTFGMHLVAAEVAAQAANVVRVEGDQRAAARYERQVADARGLAESTVSWRLPDSERRCPSPTGSARLRCWLGEERRRRKSPPRCTCRHERSTTTCSGSTRSSAYPAAGSWPSRWARDRNTDRIGKPPKKCFAREFDDVVQSWKGSDRFGSVHVGEVDVSLLRMEQS